MPAVLPDAPPIDVERFYALTKDWQHQVELIEGDVVVSPTPSPHHQQVLARLARAMLAWAEEQPSAPVVLFARSTSGSTT